MITLRLMEPWEQPIPCGARRGLRGKLRCERAALHAYGHHAFTFHAARDRRGRRHLW